MAVKYPFSAVSNKILEKVQESNLTKRQLNIIIQIWRMTFGCKNLLIAVYRPSDFGWCGVRRTVIDVELQTLKKLNIIRLDEGLGLIAINPRIEEWKCKPNGNVDDAKRTDLRNEVLSKQLKGVPILRICENKTFDEIRADPLLKEILKKLNTGRILQKEIQDAAAAYGRHNTDLKTLAERMKIAHDDDK